MRFPKSFLILVLAALPGGLWAFQVLTWNVGLLRVAGIDIVPRVQQRSLEVPETLARWADEGSLELIVLQEVWEDAHAAALEATLRPYGYSFFRPRDRAWTGVTSGLFVAWRSPLELVRAEFAPWRVREGAEALSLKGVVRVELRDPTSGLTYGVTDFHLAAQGTVDGEATQLRQLRAVIASGTADVEVLAGDANAGPGYSEPRYLELLALPGFAQAPGPDLITWDPDNPLVREGVFAGEPAAWIDHILTRGLAPDSVQLTVPSTGASDHYPLLAQW